MSDAGKSVQEAAYGALCWICGCTMAILLLIPRIEDPPVPVPAPTPSVDVASDADPCGEVSYPCDRKEVVKWKIRRAASAFHVDVGSALDVAFCESGFDQYAANPVSSAKGVYQFTDGTWSAIRAQGHQYDADENIRQFMIWYPAHPEWWECSPTRREAYSID